MRRYSGRCGALQGYDNTGFTRRLSKALTQKELTPGPHAHTDEEPTIPTRFASTPTVSSASVEVERSRSVSSLPRSGSVDLPRSPTTVFRRQKSRLPAEGEAGKADILNVGEKAGPSFYCKRLQCTRPVCGARANLFRRQGSTS